jgi:hypothetical protein
MIYNSFKLEGELFFATSPLLHTHFKMLRCSYFIVYGAGSFFGKLRPRLVMDYVRMVQGVWCLRAVVAGPGVVVFGFNASSSDGVIQQINWLNAQSSRLVIQPLADMEFCHPAANFVLYSTGVYSQVSAPPDVPTNFRSLLNAQPASPLYH